MDVSSMNPFLKRFKIVNLGISRPPANDGVSLFIDSRLSLSLDEKSALRADFESLAPVIAFNRTKSEQLSS